METTEDYSGDRQRYELCAVAWDVAEETRSTRVYWDGLLLLTDDYAPVDCRWLDGQNRVSRVGWSSPDVEAWFYVELLPVLGVNCEMPERQTGADAPIVPQTEPAQEPGSPKPAIGSRGALASLAECCRSPWRTAEDKNPYDFLNAPVVAKALELTQINKFHTKGGTGFAAEEANALHDQLLGHRVDQVGVNNQLNGPDRIADGVAIQTKYFDSATRTVGAAFDSDGVFRYRGQQLEVPRDQYAEALNLMREKIKAGQVPGVKNARDAELIVKKGQVTYQQAKNIAKAGNIDSLVFDVRSQSVVSGYAFAISFSINFAKMKWDGKPTDEALADSVTLAVQSGATSFVTGIITAQVLRTRTAAVGAISARQLVKSVARSKSGKVAIEKIAEASLGKAVYGPAAVNHVAKLLRTTVVTSVVTTIVISAPDFYRAALRKSISWKQFSKNLAVNGVGVAGGAGGAVAGAAAGRALGAAAHIPFGEKAGGVVGGVVGGVAGGLAATAATKWVLDGLIEDDAKVMVRILPECLEPLATDFMLSELETEEFIEAVKTRLSPAFLRDMYQSTNRETFVYDAFEPTCEAIIRKRPVISLPEASEVQSLLARIEKNAVA